jgi:hypothetical protein
MKDLDHLHEKFFLSLKIQRVTINAWNKIQSIQLNPSEVKNTTWIKM